jgi:hypothetical protein
MTGHIRPIRIEGDVAYVTLTQGHEAIIDAADVPLVEGVNWCVYVNKQWLYAMRSIINKQTGKRSSVLMHRVIMDTPNKMETDHINGDGLDNRRVNLRIATTSQNQANTGAPATNTSGFKGVSWRERDKKWRAQIRSNGVYWWLGLFDTPEAAHAAYVAASEVLHGEFARAA